MSVVPDTKIGKIEFCENHVDPWTTNSVAIGTDAATVTAWSTKVSNARAAYTAQQEAQAAARDATVNLNVAMQAMEDATASIIKQIRAKAGLAGDGIYALASLPVPATPSPKGAPGEPTDLTATPDKTGVLFLKFKCVNPPGTSGTIYQVWRQIGEDGPLTYLGGTGKKEWQDDTLPAGSTNVYYQIQGVRSTVEGPWGTFRVRFGVGGATSVEAAPTIAA